MNMTKLKTELKSLRPLNFFGLTVSGIINAIGVTMFLTPVNLIDSGFSGTSMLLYQVTPPYLSLAFFLVILNFPFFLLGLKRQGAAFTVYSLYAVGIYSIAAFLIQDVFPIDVSKSSPIAGQDLILCALFGGLVSGVGSGLTIRCGGAIDGVEVSAVLFAKKIGISIGTFVMIYNVVLYSVCAAVFKSWALPLYSLVAYAVGIKAVDFIVEGLDKAVAALIISSRHDELATALCEKLGHGVTTWQTKGFYAGENQTALYCVANRFQLAQIKRIVRTVDPNAFVTITEVSDTLGKIGFSDIKLRKKPLTAKQVVTTVNASTVADTESTASQSTNSAEFTAASAASVTPDTPPMPDTAATVQSCDLTVPIIEQDESKTDNKQTE